MPLYAPNISSVARDGANSCLARRDESAAASLMCRSLSNPMPHVEISEGPNPVKDCPAGGPSFNQSMGLIIGRDF